jgi:hypothetical protein
MDDRSISGRAHRLRAQISVALSLAPAWMKRGLTDKNPAKQQMAKDQLVDHLACHVEDRFVVTWIGSDDISPNAIEPEHPTGPLFGSKV